MPKTRLELPGSLLGENPEDLENYLNNGGIADLAEPLDYYLADSGAEAFTIEDKTGKLTVYWKEKTDRRLLLAYSNIGRLAGMSLHLPISKDSYVLAPGDVGASLSRRQEHGHHISHYLKRGSAPAIGAPDVVLRVQQVLADELWQSTEF